MALPLKKRPYRGGTMSVSKRLRRAENQIRKNRSEMKTITGSFNGTIANDTLLVLQPCRIAQGSGITNREGNKIRVHRIEVRGLAGLGIDHYVIQQKTSTVPDINSFSSNAGAYLLDNLNTTQFTEWLHYVNPNAFGSSMRVKYQWCPRGELIVKYNGNASTQIVDNEIDIVLVNRSDTNYDANVTVRMWYTDA